MLPYYDTIDVPDVCVIVRVRESIDANFLGIASFRYSSNPRATREWAMKRARRFIESEKARDLENVTK